MLDVLLYLFEHYMDEGRDVPHDESILKTMLKDAGFPQTEINKAFLWLEDLVRQRGPDRHDATERSSFRIFSRQELRKLGRECRGYLLLLENSGILNPPTREVIIERAMALELDDLEFDKFKLIIMMVLANQSGNDNIQDWIEALILGSSATLH